MLVRPSSKSRGFRTQAAGCQTCLLQGASRWTSLLLIFSISALAQSAGTLEAIRGARAEALESAEAELTSCVAVSCLNVNRLSLLVGYLRLSRGDATGAIGQLLSYTPPARLESVHAYYLAEARFYLRDYRAAAEDFRLAAQGSTGWLSARAQLRRGEALLAAGDSRAASPILESAASAAPAAELYYQRSLVRRSENNLKGEREDLLRIAISYPSHPYVALALARIAQIDRRPVQFTLQQRLTRARRFSDGGDLESALRELSDAERERLTTTQEERAELALQLEGALLGLDRVSLAEAQIKRARAGPPAIAADALLLRARWALRKEEHSKSRALMAEISRRYAGQQAAEDASFFVAWLDFQDGRLERASASFARFAKRYPHSRRRGDALWFRGLALITHAEYVQAEAAFDTLAQALPRSDFVPQARYWKIRCRQLRGVQKDELATRYLELTRLFPGSLYAVLSQERLREFGEDPAPLFGQSPRTLEEPTPDNLVFAAELVASGLLNDGRREIDDQLHAVQDEEQARRLGHALQRLGAYGPAYALAVRWLWKSGYVDHEGTALALLYPRPFQNAVERASETEGVDPFLAWAVMRRESTFHLDAQSAANARGLMQLMPSTGAAIAKELSMATPTADELFIPDLNIRLGVWYLTQLVKRFGHPATSAAAYNAGPQAVAQWLEKESGKPLDLFIEQMPYKETRGYVRQVVADYFIYHQLYGDPAKAPHLSFELSKPASTGVNF